ncbi:MAG: DUF4112 domain-containing protein [Gemmatimonadaceae bacterium]
MGRIEHDYTEGAEARLGNIRTLARVLDSAIRIPGTQIRVGADSIFGLVPVVGDIAGAALSGYIVLASARLGAPASTLARMVINIGIDTIVGSVPVLGDMFDVGWRANMKNVDLLENHLGGSERARRANRWIVVGVVGGLIVLGVGAAFIGVEVIRLLARIATAPRQ